ncbi:MAG: 50S ribosomal protein L24 [Spirochaetales bacterium]|jgi:large subunit ribosomal protein L24|nr:50S ribosomal protein L24 [Spirochaetales bacterium]
MEKTKTKTVFRVKKNDEVRVIAGREKGKNGRVLKVDQVKGRVLVEGVNMVKKALRKRKQNDRGGIIEIEASLHISNVMIVCKKCGPVRTGYKFENDRKIRVCKKCGEVV